MEDQVVLDAVGKSWGQGIDHDIYRDEGSLLLYSPWWNWIYVIWYHNIMCNAG